MKGRRRTETMVTDAQKKAAAKYEAEKTKQIKLKLNKRTDADILDKLEAEDNVQGYIKRLIRADLQK